MITDLGNAIILIPFDSRRQSKRRRDDVTPGAISATDLMDAGTMSIPMVKKGPEDIDAVRGSQL